ncbi:hypothetical protein [Shouchella miscanthi]|uniref:hypothetical protein n=1 Tax=Shouchella miscanthi TaxID=2598861 RepID=UPI0011A1E8BE|nr:hypothetical protein [Shouchella miscanthi]
MKRIDLLREQTEITFNHCNSCRFNNLESHSSCEGCEYFNILLNIGNDLLSITANKRIDEGISSLETKRGKVVCTLKVDEYRMLKRKGLTDPAVAKHNGCPLRQLQNWKRENRLINQ